MKGIKLLFAVCLGLTVFHQTWADDANDAVRAATRRGATNSVASARQKSGNVSQTAASADATRSTIQSAKSNTNVRDRTTTTRSGVVVRDTSRATTADTTRGQTVSARTTANVQSRATVNTDHVLSAPARTASRTAITPTRAGATRTATSPSTATRTGATTTRSATPTRIVADGKTIATARRTTSTPRVVRSATDTAGTEISAADIMSKDYKKCREVYYNCMDEFCANKDSQLKRCACSSRVNEFDNTKKQLSNVEDKLLDFNQRLLTVNMDKEDAEALFKATEGELAFNQDDKTQSKKILDEIAKKLNTSFDDSTFDRNLNAISLSLNADAAFDTVDSLQGASTTTKTGVALYNAALPVCLEMAREVCTDDELAIAESGYQMTIEQDCNTVAKSYSTQTDQAREKIREGSALLDMSRLDIYQKRNSDDILTCKKKMLDMLADSTVCGEGLGKCLDTSGRYIDPSTGEAFLTVDLANMNNLITRPDANQTWTSAPGNEVFVTFLNSKKKFLAPAMENCQDVADYVWDEFIEDALAQIKLAQESKLEEMRQSCTTLTTQCLSDTADSLEDFDARALSTFGVTADKTVNAMCADVRNACTALLETTGGDQDWVGGMTEIATDKTYETIMQTCREVGRACIIQACKSISGNFGLCESIQTSVNRKSIINRTACWDEVVACVESAGADSITKIFAQLASDGILKDGTFYESLYGANPEITNWEQDHTDEASKTKYCSIKSGTTNCVLDICDKQCGYDYTSGSYSYSDSDSYECQKCRLAEKIWGNCESIPSRDLSKTDYHNRIRTPIDSKTETLLSWFAKNTGTDNMNDSCRDTSCGPGFTAMWDSEKQTSVCVSLENTSCDAQVCPTSSFWKVEPRKNCNNCCKSEAGLAGTMDVFGNCCLAKKVMSIEGLLWTTGKEYFNKEQTSSYLMPTSTVANEAFEMAGPGTLISPNGLCLPQNTSESAKFVVADKLTSNNYYGDGVTFLLCLGELTSEDSGGEYPGGKTVKCSGKYLFVNKTSGRYITPQYSDKSDAAVYPNNYYKEENGSPTCTLKFQDNKWNWSSNTETQCKDSDNDPSYWIVEYK